MSVPHAIVYEGRLHSTGISWALHLLWVSTSPALLPGCHKKETETAPPWGWVSRKVGEQSPSVMPPPATKSLLVWVLIGSELVHIVGGGVAPFHYPCTQAS